MSRALFSFLFCLIVCRVSVSFTVLFEFCLIVCYICASRTVSSVFCFIICCVSVSYTVSLSSVSLFVTLVSRALFFLVLFDCLLR